MWRSGMFLVSWFVILWTFDKLIIHMNLVVLSWAWLAFLFSAIATKPADPPLLNLQQTQHSAPNELGHQPQLAVDQQIDETYLEQLEQKQNELDLSSLNEWVSHELNNSKAIRDFSVAQSFIVHLQRAQSYEYRWDLNIPNTYKRDYHLELNVFTYQDGTDISLVHNPDQDSYVSVQAKPNIRQTYKWLGKVYVTRTFTVIFEKEAQIIRFTNFNADPILLEINMEVQLKQAKHVKDSIAIDKQFQLPAQKLSTIFEQTKQTDKSRSQSYKWEWGFLEREERYESEMLKLTGVQLFAVIVTAIIQMYCIKSLLENKQVV